jgi:hypothetical protein
MTYQPNFKVPRVRSKSHMAYVAAQPCIVCLWQYVQVHHLTCSPDPKARGLKAGDNWTLPLCNEHHLAGFPGSLHDDGNERRWWAAHGIDPIAAAEQLWAESQAIRAGNAMP